MVDMSIASNAQRSDWWRRFLQPIKPSYWMTVIRDNGNLEIYSVPDLTLMYLVTDAGSGNKILADAMEYVSLPQTKDDEGEKSDHNTTTAILEVLMIGLGHNGSRFQIHPGKS
jgi:cleavage and polyadenylation specificity factor subunit 1